LGVFLPTFDEKFTFYGRSENKTVDNNLQAYRIWVGKAEGKRPVERPRRRRVDNIKMDLERDRMGCCGLDRTGSG
jgi:hypothetical protein